MSKEIIPIQQVARAIRSVRREKVLLDFDLAALYGVATKAPNQAVKRNAARFPEDFMFQLSARETLSLRSQFVTLKRGQHLKYRPYAFTEEGVAMLSNVLNSERAVIVNIAIMRACAPDSAAASRAHEIQFHDEAFLAAPSTVESLR